MQGKQKQVIEMYQRVQDFLGANPPPPSTAYANQKRLLDEAITRLSGHYQDQSSGQRLSRQETQRQAALRKKVRDEHLAPIAKIARAHRDVAGLATAMRVPSPGLSTMRLIQEAVGIRATVATQSALFVESGRPEDFLERLDAAIAELKGSFLGKARNVGTHVGAKRGMKDVIKVGRKAVDLIDTIVTDAFATRGDLLAKWKIAKRVKLLPSGGLRATGGTADENLESVA